MKPVTETVMVEQPYTVCRPVTTVRAGDRRVRLLRAPVHDGPRPRGRAQGARAGAGMRRSARNSPRGLFGCLHHKKKVTATVAVQCPPRTVSQRVFVSRPVTRDVTRDPLRPRDHGPPGARDPVPLRRRGARRVDCPVTTCRYVTEERVEPYEVQTCNYVREERVEPYEVQTCSYVAEERVEPYQVRTCEMVAEAARGDDPRHHVQLRRTRSGSSPTRSRPAATSPRSESNPTR